MRWIYAKAKSAAIAKRDECFMGNEDAIVFPNDTVNGHEIISLLKVNQDKGKNTTRKLIEYFHAPVDCHPENMATGKTYSELMKIVYPLLSISKSDVDTIISEIYNARGFYFFNNKSSGIAIIRDEIIPIIVQFFHIRIFGNLCTPQTLFLLSKNVILFKETISLISLPDMKIKNQVLDYIISQCDDAFCLKLKISPDISRRQLSKLIMGVFFHTGVIQIAEFVAHTIVALSQDQILQKRVKNNLSDDDLLQRLLHESLRLYPLFGITNRIATQEAHLSNGQVISKGMNIIFNFVACHGVGFENPKKFDPDRWLEPDNHDNCYIPFGAGPRMCPAKNLAYNITTNLVRELMTRYSFLSSIEHDRALTGGGLVYFFNREDGRLSMAKKEFISSFIAFKEAMTQLRYSRRVIKNCDLIKLTMSNINTA